METFDNNTNEMANEEVGIPILIKALKILTDANHDQFYFGIGNALKYSRYWRRNTPNLTELEHQMSLALREYKRCLALTELPTISVPPKRLSELDSFVNAIINADEALLFKRVISKDLFRVSPELLTKYAISAITARSINVLDVLVTEYGLSANTSIKHAKCKNLGELCVFFNRREILTDILIPNGLLPLKEERIRSIVQVPGYAAKIIWLLNFKTKYVFSGEQSSKENSVSSNTISPIKCPSSESKVESMNHLLFEDSEESKELPVTSAKAETTEDVTSAKAETTEDESDYVTSAFAETTEDESDDLPFAGECF